VKVGLIDIDSKIPNLALMKLSAYHKARGDDVELTMPTMALAYDKVYLSKVFTWTNMPGLPSNVVYGGTGIDIKAKLPDEAESLCPDYSLYRKMDYSLGFLTRGCPNNCLWCFVPEKEGDIQPAADIENFLRHKKAILLDNNVLAHEHGIKQIEKIAKLDVRIDFNQGLDARLIDNAVARLLSRVKWIRHIRFACDSKAMMSPVEKAVKNLRAAGITRELFCYMLVTNDIEDAYERAMFLKGLNVKPYAMPYRDKAGTLPSRMAQEFARWTNVRKIFMTKTWENHKKFRGVDYL